MPTTDEHPGRHGVRTWPMLVLLVAVAAFVAGLLVLDWCGGAPGGDRSVRFRVERGWGGRRVVESLSESGLVRCSWYALWRARRLGVLGRLQAGEYMLSTSMPPDSILLMLAEGEVIAEPTHWVTLPEGLTLEQSLSRLAGSLERDSAGLARAAVDPLLLDSIGLSGVGLEGYLFPETYEFADSLADREILSRIVGTGYSRWREAADSALSTGHPLDGAHEIVILASIVEREGRVDSERPLIAGVFLRRLASGMRLESCATVQYALGEVREELTYRDLGIDHPYNTYVHAGLPPGPICSPGLASIVSVLRPDTTEGYLYFVSLGDSTGLHLFARTHSEHLRNIEAVRAGGGSGAD